MRPSRRILVMVAAFAAVGVTAAAGSASGTSPREAASASSLPAWAIGPFARYAGNPILTPPVDPKPDQLWEWPEAFNPSVVVVNGVFHMLYRGAASGNVSSIGAATSHDGHHFTEASNNPVISRDLPSETHGVEDPRMYYLSSALLRVLHRLRRHEHRHQRGGLHGRAALDAARARRPRHEERRRRRRPSRAGR